MKPKSNEKPINFLRRIVTNLDFELEPVLTSLPSVVSILAFVELLASYNAGLLIEVQNLIEFDGANPEPLKKFIADWNLGEKKAFNGELLWNVPEHEPK